MKTKRLPLAIALLLWLSGSIQNLLLAQTEGVITYDRKQYWTKMYAELTFLTKDEIEREKATWGKDDEWITKMKLTFSNDESLYTYLNESGESEDGTYTWRQDDFYMYRHHIQARKTDVLTMLGKTYIIEDSLQTPTWKIMNELKEVAGYVCMKAVTEDTLKRQKITAWFSQDLALPVGPENYHGLPGVILELSINNGTVVVEATKVELKKEATATTTSKTAPEETFAKIDFKKSKKLKGKRINNATYEQLVYKHIKDSMKAQRNPFWSMRY
jgi:GLPGLI family protein